VPYSSILQQGKIKEKKKRKKKKFRVHFEKTKKIQSDGLCLLFEHFNTPFFAKTLSPQTLQRKALH